MDKTAKERMQRYRNKRRNESRVKKLVSVTEGVKVLREDVTPEHPVMKYLIPGSNRKKMEAVVLSLKRHNQLSEVYLGAGANSLSLDFVGELLEATGRDR